MTTPYPQQYHGADVTEMPQELPVYSGDSTKSGAPQSQYPPPPTQYQSQAYDPSIQSEPARPIGKPQAQKSRVRISKKWQKRLYWIVPLCIIAIVFAVLFEVYKDDFEKWVKPLSDWLQEREAWSWVIPTAILVILSFPPLFGHEIVQLIVGLAYPLGIALGIACAGAVIGEAACFVVFKYMFSGWVDKKVAKKVNWAATARVAQESGFRGVLVIRYSIVPPHLANPLFACTGMKFWLYMVTVILSLPKTMVFVALGSPSSKNSKAAKYGKVIAIGIVVLVSIAASWWIRKKMAIATAQIEQERGISHGDEETGMLALSQVPSTPDTSYHGAPVPTYPYQNPPGDSSIYQQPYVELDNQTKSNTAYAPQRQ